MRAPDRELARRLADDAMSRGHFWDEYDALLWAEALLARHEATRSIDDTSEVERAVSEALEKAARLIEADGMPNNWNNDYALGHGNGKIVAARIVRSLIPGAAQ